MYLLLVVKGQNVTYNIVRKVESILFLVLSEDNGTLISVLMSDTLFSSRT